MNDTTLFPLMMLVGLMVLLSTLSILVAARRLKGRTSQRMTPQQKRVAGASSLTLMAIYFGRRVFAILAILMGVGPALVICAVGIVVLVIGAVVYSLRMRGRTAPASGAFGTMTPAMATAGAGDPSGFVYAPVPSFEPQGGAGWSPSAPSITAAVAVTEDATILAGQVPVAPPLAAPAAGPEPVAQAIAPPAPAIAPSQGPDYTFPTEPPAPQAGPDEAPIFEFVPAAEQTTAAAAPVSPAPATPVAPAAPAEVAAPAAPPAPVDVAAQPAPAPAPVKQAPATPPPPQIINAGGRIQVHCPACGAGNAVANRTCILCGKKLPPVQP